MSAVPAPMGPEEFIESCRRCVAQGGGAEEIARLVRPALASQRERPGLWGAEELLYRSDDLLVVDLTMLPFATSAIHDHQTWAVVGVSEGREVEYFYERTGQALARCGEATIHPGEAIVLSADTIHAIANPLATPTRGLHVYGRDLVTAQRRMWDPRSGIEMPFEMKTFEAWEQELREASAAAGRVIPPPA